MPKKAKNNQKVDFRESIVSFNNSSVNITNENFTFRDTSSTQIYVKTELVKNKSKSNGDLRKKKIHNFAPEIKKKGLDDSNHIN